MSGKREPSITSSTAPTLTDTSDTQNFTASGRPMLKQDISSLSNMVSEFTPQAANLLPIKFKDSDKIMVPIALPDKDDGRRKSWFGKMDEKIRGKKQNVKIVEMTRGEYLAMMREKEEKEKEGKAENAESPEIKK